MRHFNSTPLEGAAFAFRPRSRAGDAEEEKQEAAAGSTCSFHIKIMASSKSKGARKNDSRETIPETTEEDKTELCPGFKDVDAFVKVSKMKAKEVALLSKLAAASQGAAWIMLLLRPRAGVQGRFQL